MSTYTCPVTLAQFQNYLKDTSADAVYQGLLQLILDASTSNIYTYLRRDYSPSAAKIEIFKGHDSPLHQIRWPDYDLAGGTFKSISRSGTFTDLVITDLVPLDANKVIYSTGSFFSDRWYRLSYKVDGATVCPEQVKLAVLELAYHMWEASRLGLGSLGKGSDISSVNTQSQLRFVDIMPEMAHKLQPFIWFG